MAGARDVIREQKRIREEQRRKNQEARQEAEQRRTEMEAGIEDAGLRPSVRRRSAARAAGVHHVKAMGPGSYDNKMMPPPSNKGVTLSFEDDAAQQAAQAALDAYGVGSEAYDALVDDLADMSDTITLADVLAMTEGDQEAITFASPQAEELARERGLVASDFAALAPSGSTGYTKHDVEMVLENGEE